MDNSNSNQIHLILGGARSGKTAYALSLAEKSSLERTYLASCPPFDGELKDRVENHKRERENRNWKTVEETINLKNAIKYIDENDAVLIDCITLWINNLLYEGENGKHHYTDEEIFTLTEELCVQCRKRKGNVYIVSNETGLGIIPDNPLARRFHDIAGKCNQIIAGYSDHVYFVTAGIASKIK